MPEAAQVPPGPRSVGCALITNPRPGPARPSHAALGLVVYHRPRPDAPRQPGGAMGLWGAQCVAMWGATTWVTGVRPSPLLGPLCNPSSRPWRLQVGVTPGGGPQVPLTPRGLLGGLWVAWKAALPLK